MKSRRVPLGRPYEIRRTAQGALHAPDLMSEQVQPGHPNRAQPGNVSPQVISTPRRSLAAPPPPFHTELFPVEDC